VLLTIGQELTICIGCLAWQTASLMHFNACGSQHVHVQQVATAVLQKLSLLLPFMP
jgi:hypothetical protein